MANLKEVRLVKKNNQDTSVPCTNGKGTPVRKVLTRMVHEPMMKDD